MQIVIDVAAYYDWDEMQGEPTQEDIQALRAKPSQKGKWLKKVLKEQASHTAINIPEQQIQSLMEAAERNGRPMSRAKVVALHLDQVVMPHHAGIEHFVKISVHEEPEVEAYLNRYFEIDKE